MAHVFAAHIALPFLASIAGLAQDTPSNEGEGRTPAAAGKEIGAEDVKSAIQRGVVLLLEKQERYEENVETNAPDEEKPGEAKPGAKIPRAKKPAAKKPEAKPDDEPPSEWPYEGVVRVAGEIPIGYRIGGTSICASALLDVAGKDNRKAIDEAVGRALEFVLTGLDHPLMAADYDGGYDTRGWGHAYALSFLLRLRELRQVPEKHAKDVDAAIQRMVKVLEETELEKGGWNYARGKSRDAGSPATFMTAPTLQILFEARSLGEKVDAAVIERALKTLEDARLDSSAFQYGTNPEHKTGEQFEAVPGAIGRMSVCETTLYLAGRGSVERIRGAVEAFFQHWEWLEKRRKQPGTHELPYKIAPYYFFYAHRFAAQAIEMLPAKERPDYRQKLYQLLWKIREEDGGWNDRVFARSENFGTAMTLFALAQPEMPAPAGWPAK